MFKKNLSLTSNHKPHVQFLDLAEVFQPSSIQVRTAFDPNEKVPELIPILEQNYALANSIQIGPIPEWLIFHRQKWLKWLLVPDKKDIFLVHTCL